MILPAGAINAQLAFKRCASLDLVTTDEASMIVGGQMGPSVVMVDTDVPAGAYSYTVGG